MEKFEIQSDISDSMTKQEAKFFYLCCHTAKFILYSYFVYCKLIGHKYLDHICSKCNGKDNIIQTSI
ncbi:hypothetical protein H5410_052421 [Solanum commersonii]|uniref:Uncharacterized protein n=1 Tax=Solanum commersonii TaxID=4109 RepID=A0A9J5X1E9_SOLCO|nr:hypothetical protein H5410_052421 [Solanum commersonii]